MGTERDVMGGLLGTTLGFLRIEPASEWTSYASPWKREYFQSLRLCEGKDES